MEVYYHLNKILINLILDIKEYYNMNHMYLLILNELFFLS